MKADEYWVNWSCREQVFFLNEGSSRVKWTVPAYDYIKVPPHVINSQVPKEMMPAGAVLVRLFSAGYPTRTTDEHETFILSLTEAGLVQLGSVCGNLILSRDGYTVLQAAGVV